MRGWYALFAGVLLSYQCTDGAGAVRRHVKAHEQQLQAFVEEWLRDGPYQFDAWDAERTGRWKFRLEPADQGWLAG